MRLYTVGGQDLHRLWCQIADILCIGTIVSMQIYPFVPKPNVGLTLMNINSKLHSFCVCVYCSVHIPNITIQWTLIKSTFCWFKKWQKKLVSISSRVATLALKFILLIFRTKNWFKLKLSWVWLLFIVLGYSHNFLRKINHFSLISIFNYIIQVATIILNICMKYSNIYRVHNYTYCFFKKQNRLAYVSISISYKIINMRLLNFILCPSAANAFMQVKLKV